MTWGLSVGLFFAVFAATFGATKVVLNELRRRSLLDLPNDRSSHDVPTPRGGGLAVLAASEPAAGPAGATEPLGAGGGRRGLGDRLAGDTT